MSGFNLPPGCSVSDIDRACGAEGSPCAVCHRDPDGSGEGACACEECPSCGACGDPACYEGGTCAGIPKALVKDHGEACSVCHPPKATCPKHGEYLAEDGCDGCLSDYYHLDELERQQGYDPLTFSGPSREPTDEELALGDFAYDCDRERRASR